METHNFKIFQKFSGLSVVYIDMFNRLTIIDSHLFDIIEPKHPCAGGLTIDDVQRRVTQYVINQMLGSHSEDNSC